MRLFAFLLLLPMLASAPAPAEEDGARLFTPCRACHSLDPAERVMGEIAEFAHSVFRDGSVWLTRLVGVAKQARQHLVNAHPLRPRAESGCQDG